MFRIGVISDTHNYFDPKIPRLFAGVEHILHAGDIGLPWLILELETIAPVTAVSGNTDDAGCNYPQIQVITLAGKKFLVHHIIQPGAVEEGLNDRIKRERPDVVVFGHTHKPFSSNVNGTFYFNPGYAGKSRFGMPRSVSILHYDEKGIRAECLWL